MSESRTIVLNGRELPYTLKRSARRRTIGFQIDQHGLSVRAPDHVRVGRIERALRQRESWITEKLTAWRARPQRPAPAFATGDALPFLGRDLSLRVIDLEKGVRTQVERDGDVLTVRVDPDLAGELRAATVKRALTRWYKRQAEQVYAPLLAGHARTLGKPAPKLIVRQQERRWGSCDSSGVIRMNWRLIGAEERLIDYVCAHEAAHLVEPNHSAAFWRVVAGLTPDYRDREKQLREQQFLIVPF